MSCGEARPSPRKRGIEREKLAELTEKGMTVAQISAQVGISHAAVRHWLGRYGLRTARQKRPPKTDRPEAMRECRHHGNTSFVMDGAGVYRCRRCRVEAVARRRRRVKQILVEEAGGACRICGYGRCVAALHFHHLDPAQKTLPVSLAGVTLSIDFMRAEARKCVLLCSNCHAEVEAGVTRLSVS
ncbi:MAG TPA: helix-turn-helix domain-containing protein [Solirubrobacteraceae bacterium]|jgi:transposase|nr:helix-turn-helix domain-containing protein [Solirubrobacteraceae bacterium]